MAVICDGCRVWGTMPHHCAITIHHPSVSGHGCDVACTCSVELTCAGWNPPSVACEGITAVSNRAAADGILRQHTWSREHEPICIVCGAEFDVIGGRDVNLIPACRVPVTSAIFEGLARVS